MRMCSDCDCVWDCVCDCVGDYACDIYDCVWDHVCVIVCLWNLIWKRLPPTCGSPVPSCPATEDIKKVFFFKKRLFSLLSYSLLSQKSRMSPSKKFCQLTVMPQSFEPKDSVCGRKIVSTLYLIFFFWFAKRLRGVMWVAGIGED